MNALKKLTASLLFAMISTSAFAVTDAQVFAYAEANYPSIFTGAATAGQYQQYNYRYYPASGNYLVVDTTGMIYLLGSYTGGVVTPVGLVTAFAPTITAWEATQGGTAPVAAAGTQMGGAIQGTPLNLITAATTAVTTLAGAGSSFNAPAGITTDGSNLYVADTRNNKIRKIVIATGVVTTMAGSGSAGNADGTGTAASFDGPFDITTDGSNLYVADYGNSKIRKIVIATGMVTTIAGSGVWGSTDGTGVAASFNRPSGITTDGSNLYVADTYSNKIRKIVIATGVVTTLAGAAGWGSADGTGVAASFHYPNFITTDGSNLYVSDTENYKIRKIVIATGVVTTVAGSGMSGYADGTGVAASFNYPRGITTDGSNLYIADSYNKTIRKVVIATGVVATVAGSGTVGSADGSGVAATFTSPFGLTSDGSNLYVTDYGSNTIRKIQAGGATGGTTTPAVSSLPAGYFSYGGLTWTPVVISNNTLSAANSYCTGTTFNGQTGWRLPTYAELNAALMAMQSEIWQLRYAYYSTGSNMAFIDYPNTFVTCVR